MCALRHSGDPRSAPTGLDTSPRRRVASRSCGASGPQQGGTLKLRYLVVGVARRCRRLRRRRAGRRRRAEDQAGQQGRTTATRRAVATARRAGSPRTRGGWRSTRRATISPGRPPARTRSTSATARRARPSSSAGATAATRPTEATATTPSISDNGRFVAFESNATNLPGLGWADLRPGLRPRPEEGQDELISRTSGGDPATGGYSNDASISANGRLVAFESDATNLPGCSLPTTRSTCGTGRPVRRS